MQKKNSTNLLLSGAKIFSNADYEPRTLNEKRHPTSDAFS